MLPRRIFVALFLLVAAYAASAQDSRNVAEPRYPQICKILYAELTPHSGRLPEEPIERHYRDNDRILKAMNNCPAGKSVVLHGSKTGKSIFLIGPLRLRAGITLVVDASAALWASRNPRDFDVTPGSCATLVPVGGTPQDLCQPLLLAEDAPHAAVMGDGVIDGRGGNKLLGSGETWWELAHRARVEDAVPAAPRLLVVRRSPDFTLYRITLRNAPNAHLAAEFTDGLTAWALHLDTPAFARATNGIDLRSGATNISIVDSFLRTGGDAVSPKAATAPVRHITLRNTHVYAGGGIGIGSQTVAGVSAVRIDGLTLDGSDNGLRIRSDRTRGGLVEDLRFENVCMRAVVNPIVFNPLYTALEGNRVPWFRNLLLHNVHAVSSGPAASQYVTLEGLDGGHKLEATFDNVTIDNLKSAEVTAKHATFTIRHGNLDPGGDDVRASGAPGAAAPFSCEAKFIPFDQNFLSPTSDEIVPPEDRALYVSAGGTGDFASVAAAVNRLPATGGLVLIAPGTYRERVLIPQSHVTLRGSSPDPRRTVLVFDLSRATQTSAPGTATVRVRGDDFTAENLTIENDFARTHPGVPAFGTRALSLGGDRNLLRNVHLLGAQETFYLGAKDCGEATGSACEVARTYIAHSYIAGNINFIYGDGLAYFDDCELHSTDHLPGGVVTGQGKHYATQESAFVFRNARLTADPNAGKVFLGRPWRDLATVIFLNPQLGSHVAPAAWREGPRENASSRSRLDSAYLRLYNPSGPAAPTQSRQLTPQEAQHYTPREVLGGKDNWDPH